MVLHSVGMCQCVVCAIKSFLKSGYKLCQCAVYVDTSFISVGCVPVTIRPPHPQNVSSTLPTVRMIVEVSKSVAILTNSATIKLLKSKVRQEFVVFLLAAVKLLLLVHSLFLWDEQVFT